MLVIVVESLLVVVIAMEVYSWKEKVFFHRCLPIEARWCSIVRLHEASLLKCLGLWSKFIDDWMVSEKTMANVNGAKTGSGLMGTEPLQPGSGGQQPTVPPPPPKPKTVNMEDVVRRWDDLKLIFKHNPFPFKGGEEAG